MRFLPKKISGLVGAALLSLGAGCFFSTGTPPAAVYAPQYGSAHSALPVRLGTIRNISGAGREFLIRRQGGLMTALPERCWLELPEVMLEKALRERFDFTGSNVLNAVICRQEIAAETKVLHYTVVFELMNSAGGRREFRCNAAVPVTDGDAAAAMTGSLKDILDRMEKYILEQK
jgi:hypothetical protein